MGRGKTTFVQAVIENRMNAGAVGQWSDIRILEQSAVNVDIGKKRDAPQPGRFSIGSAPLTSITELDAQISGGETRQDLKIPGVSPWRLPRALSCSCLSVYRCHSAVMAAVSHSTPDTQFREGSSLQAGLYARTPRSVRLLRLTR